MRALALTIYLYSGLAAAVTPTPLPGGSAHDWQVQLQRLQRLMLEQEQLLQALQTEVREVRGDNEMLRHRLEELTQRQRNLGGDFDQRLSRLENASPSTDNSAIAAKSEAATENASRSSVENAESADMKETPSSDSGGLTENTAATAATEADAPLDDEKTQYQNAFEQLQAGHFETAIHAFSALLETYPNGEYADNAQYWIAESQYAKQDYNAALRSFNKLLENYPDSNKRAHALLKIGYAYDALGNAVKARQVLEYVRDTFPTTATARLAQERLQRMR